MASRPVSLRHEWTYAQGSLPKNTLPYSYTPSVNRIIDSGRCELGQVSRPTAHRDADGQPALRGHPGAPAAAVFRPAATARRRGRDARPARSLSCHNGPISATSSVIAPGSSPVIRRLRMLAAHTWFPHATDHDQQSRLLGALAVHELVGFTLPCPGCPWLLRT